MRKLKPEICTSGSGCEPPQEHCRECSHAVFVARMKAGGRIYRLEYSPRFGPEFGRAGQKKVDTRWLPRSGHPVWKAFAEWHKRKFGSFKVREF